MKFILLLMSLSWAAHALPLKDLQKLDGSPAQLEHKKNTELVVFWATWCPECKDKLGKELPKLNGSKEVAVVTINTDRNAKRAGSYVEKAKVSLPVLRDPKKVLRKPLKVFSVPHWAVYKRQDSNSTWQLIDSAPAFEWERIQKAIGPHS